eukprot:gnl/Ergobibamus_cyprinoides/4447.p2 GENE.gnl/Ergobibamus_cyprinoides/4447~~gnl/Ergobibamus_cyprinoides/4447.p2  ORF type:complete len:130 (+),score=49.09 gnl/Ergobibamus_cyprinoides/4447:241-630(+)
MEAVCDGIAMAETALPAMTVRIIVCGMRHLPASASRAVAEIAWRYRDRGVVAFDLAGPESGFPSKQHKEAFDLVRDQLLNATIHAGEAYGPASVRDSIRFCGAQRIGHGVRLTDDPDLLNFVVDRRIPS